QRADQTVAGADLGFAEEQRRIVPAAVQRIDDAIRDSRHLGLVAAEATDHHADVAEHARTVETEMIGAQADIGPFLLQDVEQPMRQLDVAIAGALGVAHRLAAAPLSDALALPL